MSGVLDPGFRAALCKTYADLLRRQRTADSPFAQWSRATRREHEFVWLDGLLNYLRVMGRKREFTVEPDVERYESVHKM